MGPGHLLRWQNLCYILIMRLWMRARMRRRGKRGVNDSESTGKIGQEIPANQPTPLQPMYPQDERKEEQRRKAPAAAEAAEATSVKAEEDLESAKPPMAEEEPAGDPVAPQVHAPDTTP